MNVLYVMAFESCITGRECVHLLTHGYFRSRDEDGGQTVTPLESP